jgi:dephospho-CoA kinase
MITIGITGTLGAGKGTVVEYLVTRKGFLHYSVRDYLRAELENRKMPVNRDTLTSIANKLRAKHGSAYLVEQLFKKAQQIGQNSIIESIRNTGEIQNLRKQENFFLLALDADARLRYKRIRSRNSETDQVSYHKFMQNEEREMHATDPNNQSLMACIHVADFVIVNNSSIKNLHRSIEDFLNAIKFNSKQDE